MLCCVFCSAPYIDHALSAFGFERCLAEGNWFVSDRMGDPYSRVFQLLKDACDRAVRTQTPSAAGCTRDAEAAGFPPLGTILHTQG